MIIELLIIAGFAAIGGVINYLLVKAKGKTITAYKSKKSKKG